MDAILLMIPKFALHPAAVSIVCFGLGIGLTLILTQIIAKARSKTFEQNIKRQIEGAKKEAENIIKSAQLDAAAENMKKKEQFAAEVNKTRAEMHEAELRFNKREDTLDRQAQMLQQQEREFKKQSKEVERRVHNIASKEKQLSTLMAQQKNQLLKITAMDIEAAKTLLLKRLEDECEHEMSALIQRKVDEATENADEKSREIISSAIQRFAAEHTCEVSVSTVEIPNDDMKGRIIGREGRNIRAFEKATGVDVIVDDTPGMIVVSGFNPVRREVARLSMERLIQDGRIHPSRIEELVAQTKKDVNHKVGALNFRTSFGQNVLRHSIEVAFLTQIMADELGLDGSIARRAGFLHDIGKAIDHEIEGGQATIGANFLKRFNESPIILNSVEAHHGDVPANNPYAPLVAAADAVSASRPGARRETLERYIKRLEKLEEIASGFKGVENAYAIQAGREIRVIVSAEQVDDEAAMKIARDIAGKIEDEMAYPGEIQVTLLREVRCIEYAK
jgi:ribonuclease Y